MCRVMHTQSLGIFLIICQFLKAEIDFYQKNSLNMSQSFETVSILAMQALVLNKITCLKCIDSFIQYCN